MPLHRAEKRMLKHATVCGACLLLRLLLLAVVLEYAPERPKAFRTGLHAAGLRESLLLLEALLKLLQPHAQLVHRLYLALQHPVQTHHVALHIERTHARFSE